MKSKHYWYIERETGEEFIVCADSDVSAEAIAYDAASSIASWYDTETSLEFLGIMTEEEAEASGLDEY